MDPKCAQNLKPEEIVALLRAHTRAAFGQKVDAPLLLVRIEDARGDLALTLEAALEEGATTGRRLDPSLGYETFVGSRNDLRALSFPVSRASFTGADLHRRLLRTAFFAISLHKRRGATNVFTERISVGRVHTNDIVLRHHSVSKFHAWFERDDDDGFYVSDAKSTNATLLNGTDISGAAQVRVVPGDEIRFGDIVTLFCPAGILWDAVMLGGGAPSSGRVGSSVPPRSAGSSAPPSSLSPRPVSSSSGRPPASGSGKPPSGREP